MSHVFATARSIPRYSGANRSQRRLCGRATAEPPLGEVLNKYNVVVGCAADGGIGIPSAAASLASVSSWAELAASLLGDEDRVVLVIEQEGRWEDVQQGDGPVGKEAKIDEPE